MSENHEAIVRERQDVAIYGPTPVIRQFGCVDGGPGCSLIFGSPAEDGVGFVAAKAHGQIDDGTVAGDSEGRIAAVRILSTGIEFMDDMWWRQGGSTILGDGDRGTAFAVLAMKPRRDIGCNDCAL